MEIEFDKDGYPTTRSLKAIKKLDIHQSQEFILSLLEDELPYAFIRENKTDDGERLVEFATGGWSGNEEIIDAMLSNFNIKMFSYYAWKIGGLHTFRINENLLKPAPPTGNAND